MKRKLLNICLGSILALGLALGMTACGDSDNPYAGLNYDDYIKVGQYKGLDTEPIEVKVSQDDVHEKIDQALASAAKEKELGEDEEIKKGDTANIDFVGKIDGKEFEGGSAKGTDLQIGSGQFIDGFEDGLIGKKPGEKASLDLAFPDDYQNTDVAGKDVTFDVTINSVKRSETPKYDDDFIKNNTDFKSRKEYEESLKKTIKEDKKSEAETQQKTELWGKVMDTTEMLKYPKDILKHYEDVFAAQIDKTVKETGMERSEVLSQYYGISDEETLKKMIQENSQMLIQQEMAIEYIADKENLTCSKEDKEKQIEQFTAMGYDDESIEEMTGRNMDQYARITLLYQKVQDLILENAKVSDGKDSGKNEDKAEDKSKEEEADKE